MHNYAYHKQFDSIKLHIECINVYHKPLNFNALHNDAYHKPFNSSILHNYPYHKQFNSKELNC